MKTYQSSMTLVLPYYRNAGMLKEHQAIWRQFPDDVRKKLHVIVVDDGSPKAPARDVFDPETPLGSYRLYRNQKDVRWNWLFCRNLGMAEATTDWVFLTDIDHVVPLETWRALFAESLDEQAVYRFSRVDAVHPWPWKLRNLKPRIKNGVESVHPNTWLMTRTMFDAIGGYDERFSGYYGTDGEFRDRVHATAQRIIMRTDPIVRYPREIIPDASTTSYERKVKGLDDVNVRRVREERELIPNWRPLRLTFPWERQC